jgi:hypothetical protein
LNAVTTISPQKLPPLTFNPNVDQRLQRVGLPSLAGQASLEAATAAVETGFYTDILISAEAIDMGADLDDSAGHFVPQAEGEFTCLSID